MHLAWKQLRWGEWAKGAFAVWLRRYKVFFLVLFIIVSGIGGYQWYRSLFSYHWNEEERRAYLAATVKETSFNEEKFTRVLEQLSVVRSHHEIVRSVKKNIFPGGTKRDQR